VVLKDIYLKYCNVKERGRKKVMEWTMRRDWKRIEEREDRR
jgi:hypothetical protein